MNEQILLWAGLGVLAVLCLPIAAIQKLVLEVCVWALRLALLGLLAAGAYLWFRPAELPAGVSAMLNDFPGLLGLLPARGSPAFALCLACWVVAALVPLLAILDVTRKLAGRRLCRIRALTAHPVILTPVAAPRAAEPAPMAVPVLRPVNRRTAADAVANAGTRTSP
jgi:hypothetical protein